MDYLLFVDTETTGLPKKHIQSLDPSQPHLVQLAAILTNSSGEEISCCNFVIKPEGFSIPEEASRIHGISNELAETCGIPIATVLSVFNNLCIQSSEIVAHNIEFDRREIEREILRKGIQSRFVGKKSTCTMELWRERCHIPPTEKMVKAGITKFKSPSLAEAYELATGSKLENAHNALVDVRACKEIYFKARGDSL